MKRILFIIFLLCSFMLCAGQRDTIKKVLYTTSFQFKDGIYLNIEQLKHNNPIPKLRLITDVNHDDNDFFKEIVKFNIISFYDDYGIKQEIPTDEVWGYCNNNGVYINYSDDFNRINVIGSVCHFVAFTKVYRSKFNDPFYDINSMGYTSYQSNELREYFFDFETGKVMDLSVENVTIILRRNNKLFNEYYNLNKRKKRQLMYFYLRKYDEITPLYLDVNK